MRRTREEAEQTRQTVIEAALRLFDLREEIPFFKAQLRRMLALPPEAGHDRTART